MLGAWFACFLTSAQKSIILPRLNSLATIVPAKTKYLDKNVSVFDNIHEYFTIRGHSYLPCDRDLGIVRRNLKKNSIVFIVLYLTPICRDSSFCQQQTQISDSFYRWKEYNKF